MSNDKKQGLRVFNKIFTAPAKETAQTLIDNIKEGEVDAAYMMVALKKLSKVVENVLTKPLDKEAKILLEEGIKAHQEGTAKTFSVYGARVTLADSGGLMYNDTEDPYLEELEKIEKQVKELVKLRKEYHKTKVKEWNAENSVSNIIEFGVRNYNVSWDKMPKFILEDAYGEVETNPPTKAGKAQLRFTV